MSFKNGEMHTISVLGAVVVTASLFLPVLFLTERVETPKIKLDNMESIEASIAYKKTPQKQPQKKTSQPEPKKEETITHDDKAKPVEGCKVDADCKTDEKCKDARCVPKKEKQVVAEADPKDPFKNFKRTDDDDNPAGKPVTEPGAFNGSEEGWATVTKGDPYWQKFAQDIHDNFTLPTISDENGTAVGCFHMDLDGKIVDTKIKSKSGIPDIDLAAEHAIDAVKKLRNDNPIAVPEGQKGVVTRWICFRFDPKSV